MDLKLFKDFCVQKIIHNIYNPEIGDIRLFSNDAELKVEVPDVCISDFEQLSTKDRIRQKFDIGSQFHKSPSIYKFLELDIFIIQTLDMNALPHAGISFKKLQAISDSILSQDISVAGDGNDYQLGEHTSGHDKEIILTIKLENKPELLQQYENWIFQRNQANTPKKRMK